MSGSSKELSALLINFMVLLFQVPTASITVEGNPALNRVRWAHSGREIAVGDSDGRVFVYDVGEVSRHDSAFTI